MKINKEKLIKILKDQEVKTTDDLQDLMRIMTKEIVEAVMEGEINSHLGYKKNNPKPPEQNNSRNGKTSKKVKSRLGPIEINSPRDRDGSFQPQIIKKHQRDISGIEAKVLSMYAKGMSTRDIQYYIHDIYGMNISPETVSNITDSIMDKAKEWQSRPLEQIYSIVFMDAMMVKMRIEGIVKNIALYCIIGFNIEGQKEVLGFYVSETESAKYWLSVMNELKNRGLEDVLIFAVDNLPGISEAIQAVFPNAEIQKCIVHQIRNSLKFVPWKERKQVAADLKLVYTASTEKQALNQLEIFIQKWDKKYPHISKSWNKNWSELSTFFKYPPELRKLIYTTNPIESFNRSIRKVIKNKSILPNEDALTKIIYLAIHDITKRWTAKHKAWGIIYPQLVIYFEERLNI